MTFCAPEMKAHYLTECLLEVINERWWLDMTESGHPHAYKAFIQPGKKYLKVVVCDVTSKHEGYDGSKSGRVFMFVDKNTGDCYKPASFKAPAKVFGSTSTFWLIILRLLILMVPFFISDKVSQVESIPVM